MMELNKQIIEVAKENDFYLEEVEEQDGKYFVEMNNSTPCGEDWWETIWFDGTNEGFVGAIRQRANSFDVDEESEVWIEGRGENGIPDSIEALVEDAKWKKNQLKELADALEELDDEDTGELKNYRCTISITDGEQTEEQDFYVEAKSFEEAVENIQNDLDIFF